MSKNKRKPIWLGSSGDNLRSTGEYIGHNFLNWKEPRIPSSSPPSIPKINLQFVDDLIWTLIFALSSHQLLNCRSFKFCKRKLGNMGKTKHYGPKMEFAGLSPFLLCFFRPQTFSLRDVVVWWIDFLHNPFMFCMHRSFNRLSQKR